ncbi:hypothetical protein SAMN05421688_1549 [Poseidonocella pacifica]|uniref:Uncharacterized protein n=1 Tax=Poseidonocella pacifica TaxID=871651 RepID=A0A1I0WNF8_9RHOB|nr:hypothetical protein [Poseidonocella pacifica]SFA89496.1 hypothetical protein SAMN05421688_1549 [Poseidonocella pacifica]
MTDRQVSGDHDDHEGARYARELNTHLRWLDSFTGAALGVLASASGIYTYLGVRSLLDDTGAWTTFAALSYSLAVSVGIFVFWSYLMRLLPAVRSAASKIGLFLCMALGSLAIIAMSSWLNAAALAGAAAVEQHLAHTVQTYQGALERTHSNAIAGQALGRDVARVRETLSDLSEQEAVGDLSGLAGRGAVFRVLTQKSAELDGLEAQITSQERAVEEAFAQGNAILSRMRSLTVEPGAVDGRSVRFAEEAVRLSGLIAELRQLNVAPLVSRAAADLRDSVILPDLDADSAEGRVSQQSTINSVLTLLGDRATTLEQAAEEVQALPEATEIEYTPLSAADAVIRYAGNFVPSWAGAIAIDLLPAVLVFILMVTHSAIRTGQGAYSIEDTMTVAEMRAALEASKSLDVARRPPHTGAAPE